VRRTAPGAFLALLLGACSSHDAEAPAFERIVAAPATFAVDGEGSLRSSKPTKLTVPGQQWSPRLLTFAVADGTWVKEGEVVARFAADESRMELAKALIDVQRAVLARSAKQEELGDVQGKLDVDLAQVAGLLGIAHRYAHATEGALARNDILDAVQDEQYLGVKQGALEWRKGNSATRGKVEIALVDAQRATGDTQVKDKRDDLHALELRAPHAGPLVLEPDWSGEKPRVGQSMWAGNTFATLPDTASMEVEISLPQAEAQGVKEGLDVELAPLGESTQKVASKISWVAAAAAARGRDSPVKYLSLKASVPADAVARYRWTPGLRFRAHMILLRGDHVLTVPNIALQTNGETTTVSVRGARPGERRVVHLGVRGPSRSQVLDGLVAGDEIVLNARAPAGAAAAAIPGSTTDRRASP